MLNDKGCFIWEKIHRVDDKRLDEIVCLEHGAMLAIGHVRSMATELRLLRAECRVARELDTDIGPLSDDGHVVLDSIKLAAYRSMRKRTDDEGF